MTQSGDFGGEIDGKWLESEARIDKVSTEQAEWALSGRPLDPETNSRWMNETTAHYCFWVAQERVWDAIKTNNEVAHYVQLKKLTDTKFVSAVAERESSLAVARERYMRNRAEANRLKCEQIINTTKMNQRAIFGEKITANGG